MRALAGGPLGRAGGVAVLRRAPGRAHVRRARLRGARRLPESSRQVLERGDGARPRRHALPRASHRRRGRAQDTLYASPWLHAFLSAQCGTAIVPSGNRGSYSFYVEPGDHLGLHLDVDTCDVTLITVLHDDTDPAEPGRRAGRLPRRASGRRSREVRAAPEDGMALIKARPARASCILGGLVPHRVLPLGPWGQRIISALCFRAGPAGPVRAAREPTRRSSRGRPCARGRGPSAAARSRARR